MPTPSTTITAIAIENLFFIAVHSRTHLVNKPQSVYGRNIFNLRKSYFSIYSMHHGLVALWQQVQPQLHSTLDNEEHSAISAPQCGGMHGGWSCCPSSPYSVPSDSMRLRVPSKGHITNGAHTFLHFIRLSLTPIIIGGRSLQRC